MGPFEMVCIIVIASLGYAAYEAKLKSKSQDDALSESSSELENMKQELAELKQRVAALETIVTDKKYDLSEQIEELRS
ncbi:hypothetical protein HR060_07275 [Catenovulum sp. SM1970]|uniref:hypothetical protein n=1 Tax=Marinifaba aquimaris TaxID=2741323 RepID=UPI001574DD27|nr:hypothetical protein [Marinifaba aquimaris]NTS76668.1 hypothetical protein [Marinifaba aquimaris]